MRVCLNHPATALSERRAKTRQSADQPHHTPMHSAGRGSPQEKMACWLRRRRARACLAVTAERERAAAVAAWWGDVTNPNESVPRALNDPSLRCPSIPLIVLGWVGRDKAERDGWTRRRARACVGRTAAPPKHNHQAAPLSSSSIAAASHSLT